MSECFRTMKCIYTFPVGVKVNSLLLTSDDKTLIITSYGDVKIWNLVDNKCIYTFNQLHKGNIQLVLSRISMSFYSSGEDGIIKKCSLRDGKVKESFGKKPTVDDNQNPDKIFFIGFALNESELITGHSNGRISIWNTRKKRIVNFISDPRGASISFIAQSCERRLLFTIVSDLDVKTLTVWLFSKKRVIHTFKNIHSDAVKVILITRDDKYVITGSSDKSIAVWDWRKKCMYHRFEDAHTVTTISCSFDNDYIISGSTDSCIKVWRLEKKECVMRFIRAHSSAISSLAMSRVNKRMISSTWDKIKIWSCGENEDTHKVAIEANDRSCRIENCSLF